MLKKSCQIVGEKIENEKYIFFFVPKYANLQMGFDVKMLKNKLHCMPHKWDGRSLLLSLK